MADINKEGSASIEGKATMEGDTGTKDFHAGDGTETRDDSGMQNGATIAEDATIRDEAGKDGASPDLNGTTSTAAIRSEATEKSNLRLCNLSYAAAQIDVATNALDQAYKALCKVDRHVLCSRPLKEQTKSIWTHVEPIARLGEQTQSVGAEQGGEGDESAAKPSSAEPEASAATHDEGVSSQASTAQAEPQASTASHGTIDNPSQTAPPVALTKDEQQAFYAAVTRFPVAPPASTLPTFVEFVRLLSLWDPAELRRFHDCARARNYALSPRLQRPILYKLRLISEVEAGADAENVFVDLCREIVRGHDIIGFGDLIRDRGERARRHAMVLRYAATHFPVFVRGLGMERLSEVARKERLKALVVKACELTAAEVGAEESGVEAGPRSGGATDGNREVDHGQRAGDAE